MTLDLGDIQGLVLRGYTMPHARHFVLSLRNGIAAAAWLRALATGAEGHRVTSALPWTPAERPDHALNVGLTYVGLRALQILPEANLEAAFRSFRAFRDGAVARATLVGDVGPSAPPTWTAKLCDAESVHCILSLHARTPVAREDHSACLRRSLDRSGGFVELGSIDGDTLPENRVHFNYRDGISQPTIEGGPARAPDRQPAVPPYHFVLQDDDRSSYYLPQPVELGRNGSFAAFRVLAQDVAGFERFLASLGGDPEWWAAKMMGRWRDGTPLALSPDAPRPDLEPAKLNDFDYGGDALGAVCPAGAHVRRTNPRDVRVLGGNVSAHRVVRRGMPYGPPFDPEQPDDGIERGLLGMFIASSLENQFEFLMQSWVNEGGFTGDLTFTHDAKDPICGDQSPPSDPFVIPGEAGGTRQIKGLPAFVRTRGAAYLFLPSLTALRFIGDQ
jgi:Dyp-type peroxidase family